MCPEILDAPPAGGPVAPASTTREDSRLYSAIIPLNISASCVHEVPAYSVGGFIGATVPSRALVELSAELTSGGAGHPVRVTSRWIKQPPVGPDPLLVFLLTGDAAAPGVLDALRDWTQYGLMPRPVRRNIEKVLGRIRSRTAHADALARLQPLMELRTRIWKAVLTALERRCAAGLAESDLENHSFENLAREWSSIELQLPIPHLRGWARRLELMPQCAVEITGLGVVRLRPPNRPDFDLHSCTAWALVAGLPGVTTEGPGSLVFDHQRSLDAKDIEFLLDPLLQFHGIPANEITRLRASLGDAGGLDVSFSLQLPIEAAQAWQLAPRERSERNYVLMSLISRRVQACLRRWLPLFHFAGHGRLEDTESAYAMLTYQASRPYYNKKCPDYTYDPMNPSSIAQACRHATKALPRRLAAVRQRLAADGKPPEIELYRDRLTSKIQKTARQNNKHFKKLLQADVQAMERFKKLGIRCNRVTKELEKFPEEAARHILRSAEEVDHSFRVWLRRLFGWDDASRLGPLLLIEATAVLSAFYERPAPIRTLIRVRETGPAPNPREFLLQSRYIPSKPERL